MKLARSTSRDGRGKYSLIDNRYGSRIESTPGSPKEFFVLMLKDVHATAALEAYANSIRASDPEFAQEVDELAKRSGSNHPNAKQPD